MISEVSIHRQLSFLCLAHVFKWSITVEGCQVKGDQEAEWDWGARKNLRRSSASYLLPADPHPKTFTAQNNITNYGPSL